MKVVRCLTVAFVSLTTSTVAAAQLPGFPSPWQTGVGYFVGPYGSGASNSNPASGVYCIDMHYILQYGFPWQAFIAPVAPNNATPSGYTYAGIGPQCLSPGQPNGSNPNGVANFSAYHSNQYGFGMGSGPLVPTPPTPPLSYAPTSVAAFRILPQAPPPPPPPPSPPESPPPESSPPESSPPESPPPPPAEPPVTPPPTLDPHVAPEPATWLLLGTGLVAILGFAAIKGTRA